MTTTTFTRDDASAQVVNALKAFDPTAFDIDGIVDDLHEQRGNYDFSDIDTAAGFADLQKVGLKHIIKYPRTAITNCPSWCSYSPHDYDLVDPSDAGDVLTGYHETDLATIHSDGKDIVISLCQEARRNPDGTEALSPAVICFSAEGVEFKDSDDLRRAATQLLLAADRVDDLLEDADKPEQAQR